MIGDDPVSWPIVETETRPSGPTAAGHAFEAEDRIRPRAASQSRAGSPRREAGTGGLRRVRPRTGWPLRPLGDGAIGVLEESGHEGDHDSAMLPPAM